MISQVAAAKITYNSNSFSSMHGFGDFRKKCPSLEKTERNVQPLPHTSLENFQHDRYLFIDPVSK